MTSSRKPGVTWDPKTWVSSILLCTWMQQHQALDNNLCLCLDLSKKLIVLFSLQQQTTLWMKHGQGHKIYILSFAVNEQLMIMIHKKYKVKERALPYLQWHPVKVTWPDKWSHNNMLRFYSMNLPKFNFYIWNRALNCFSFFQNKLELEFLVAIDWNVYVSQEDFQRMTANLETAIATRYS